MESITRPKCSSFSCNPVQDLDSKFLSRIRVWIIGSAALTHGNCIELCCMVLRADYEIKDRQQSLCQRFPRFGSTRQRIRKVILDTIKFRLSVVPAVVTDVTVAWFVCPLVCHKRAQVAKAVCCMSEKMKCYSTCRVNRVAQVTLHTVNIYELAQQCLAIF